MAIIKMTDLNLKNKRVLIREDFNVPIKNGKVTSDARIQAALFTIEAAHKAGARIMLMSHLGRPHEGKFDEKYSLKPVAVCLSKLLGLPVRLEKDWIDGVDIAPNEIVLCENVRFQPGEHANSDELSKKIAGLCDIFVMDAFGTAHRAQVSTHGVAKFAPIACAGPLLTAELEALTKALEDPSRPLLSIVGGSKVSTKVGVLTSVIKLSDILIVGGGIANTFLAAQGINIGKSLYEPDLVAEAKDLFKLAKLEHTLIPMPTDVVVAKELSENAKATVKLVAEIADDDMILDIGPASRAEIAEVVKRAQTIIWNGPLGVFEIDQFAEGTEALAKAIAVSKAFSIAGGGDTLAAIEKFNITEKISYVSTGGGAFLEFLEYHQLPAVAILEERAQTIHK